MSFLCEWFNMVDADTSICAASKAACKIMKRKLVNKFPFLVLCSGM